MSHTRSRHSFKLSWAIGLGLTASALLHSVVAAAPAGSEPPIRDQWYLDPPTEASAPAVSVQFRDRWYLEDTAPYATLARSHRSQEDAWYIA